MTLFFQHKSDERIHSTARFRDNLKLMNFAEFPFIRVIMINTMAMSLLGLAIPLSIQSVINIIVSRAMRQPLVMLCVILLCILSFSAIIQVIQTYTVETLKRRLFVRFGLVISERLTHYKDEVFRKENSPALIDRYFDTLIMQSSMVTFFVDGFGFLLMFLIGFGLLIVYHPYFLVFALAMAGFLIGDWLLFGPDGVRAGSPEADGKYSVVNWIEELSRVRNMFASEYGRDFSNQKITRLFNHWLEKRNILFNYQFRQHIGLQVFSVSTNVLLLFIGGLLVLEQQLSVGQLVAAALVVSNIMSSIPRLQSFFFSIYDYSTALDKIAQFYDYPLEKEASVPISISSYDIEYKDIFVAPNYHFNTTLPAGKKIFVMVKSFSSIDVLYDAMMGFTTPSQGTVSIGGIHQDEIDIARFRNQVQLIRNDQFFAGTVRENLTFNGSNPDLSRLQEILETVGLWSVIQELPDRMETIIRPNGFPFSRSQLLTLQVARAMITQPKILFVTPDFEHISSDKRPRIFNAITHKSTGWTLMFFTQRYYEAAFDRYTVLEKDGLQPVAGPSDFEEGTFGPAPKSRPVLAAQ